MPVELTYPVQVLREHIVALEAGLSVCLADPGHKPVHRLRTETRRVEAQLSLLEQLSKMPKHRDEASRLRRALRRLRRAAGEVRDVDVQRKRLEELAGAGQGPENVTGLMGVSEAAETDLSLQATAAEELRPAGQALAKGATALRDRLSTKREHAVADLQMLLKKHQSKAAGAAEALLEVLEDAEQVTLPAAALVGHAEDMLRRDGLLKNTDVNSLDEDDLHTVRKAAKAARYIAETMPESSVAVAAAGRFEALQQAGGQWHDALDLTRAARRFLGKEHALSVFMAVERDRNLVLYRKALDEMQKLGKGDTRAAKAPARPPRKTVSKRVHAAA